MNGLTLFLATIFVAFLGTAHAQDAAPAAAGAPANGEAPAVAAAPQVDEDRAATAAEKELERDLAKFWGSRRKVKVVQRRLYEKDGRFEFAPVAGIIPNDDFITYFPVGTRVSYHFSEAFTVEASFIYAIDNESDLTKFLTAEGIDLKRADIQEYIRNYYNVNLLWAPIYGKISLLGFKLSHFETYVGMGFGFFSTHEIPADNPNGNDKSKPSGNTIVGFRWFINDMFNVRTEYRQHFFQKFGGGVSIPVELTLGFGVTI
jgi:outer membrane beta-barrel protein